MDALKELKNLDRDTLLGALGLQTKQQPTDTVLAILGSFAAGMLVGTGIGMLVAPKTGRTLRRQLRRGAHELVDRAQDGAQEAAAEVRSHVR